jgi:hypothetical protein
MINLTNYEKSNYYDAFNITNTKDKNTQENEKREEFIFLVYNNIITEPLDEDTEEYKKLFNIIEKSKDDVFKINNIDKSKITETKFERKGKMGNNFDYELVYTIDGQTIKKKIELKKGETIPQILQLQANKLLDGDFVNKTYFENLQKLCLENDVPFEFENPKDYGKEFSKVGSANKSTKLNLLYERSKSDKDFKDKLSECDNTARKSIVESQNISIDKLNEHLEKQKDKTIIWYIPSLKKIVVFKYTDNQLTVTRFNRIEKHTTYVFDTLDPYTYILINLRCQNGKGLRNPTNKISLESLLNKITKIPKKQISKEQLKSVCTNNNIDFSTKNYTKKDLEKILFRHNIALPKKRSTKKDLEEILSSHNITLPKKCSTKKDFEKLLASHNIVINDKKYTEKEIETILSSHNIHSLLKSVNW